MPKIMELLSKLNGELHAKDDAIKDVLKELTGFISITENINWETQTEIGDLNTRKLNSLLKLIEENKEEINVITDFYSILRLTNIKK
ncbi:MAG: hypothetical protein HGB12_06430 [Bacteroidetes bacterium]|nr:hypothetical protein [Bacteroidota bacterium]